VTDLAPRVAIYARVSTEDQAERQTVEGQLKFLRDFCKLYSYEIASEYVDEGYSGALRLGQRPQGKRLFDDAKAGGFTQVLVYRLDRLGRSLRALLEAHQELEAAGVTIRSVTEPFDTTSSLGRFVFQLLGSVAELERETITERMSMGRARTIRDGKYSGGAALPYGYDVDEEGYIVPSTHLVLPLGITEADLVRDIFERVANGESLIQEARRLNSLGVPPTTRSVKKPRREAVEWRASRISYLLRNPAYKGEHTMTFKSGTAATGAIPPLVPPELWERARTSLRTRIKEAPVNAQRDYLLRGLMVCAECGKGFSGVQIHTQQKGGRKTFAYYKCISQVASNTVSEHSPRCTAKSIRADIIEKLIWSDILNFLKNPGVLLDQARDELTRPEKSGVPVERRQALEKQIAGAEIQKERMLALYRRGLLPMEKYESQLAEIDRETSSVRLMLEAIATQDALYDAEGDALRQAADVISIYASHLDAAEMDFGLRRKLVELLVERLVVETVQSGTRDKKAQITVVYSAPITGVESVGTTKKLTLATTVHALPMRVQDPVANQNRLESLARATAAAHLVRV
jgi:site-specific DNA recombinase